MGKDTKIEWCDHTINLWWGCTKVHTGCDNCYAENTARRWGNDVWGTDKPRKEIKKAFPMLAKLNKYAREQGVKQTVFIGSMMDIFEKTMPLVDSKGKKMQEDINAARIVLFSEIEAGLYDNLIFLFLTKRPSNISKYIFENWQEKAPDNVWFGCSISDQKTANDLVKKLIVYTPRVCNRFLSIEPQTDKISLEYFPLGSVNDSVKTINWVIQGGESGIKRRPFKLEWAYMIRAQCKAAGIPYFFKQIDKVKQIPPDLYVRQFPKEFKK